MKESDWSVTPMAQRPLYRFGRCEVRKQPLGGLGTSPTLFYRDATCLKHTSDLQQPQGSASAPSFPQPNRTIVRIFECRESDSTTTTLEFQRRPRGRASSSVDVSHTSKQYQTRTTQAPGRPENNGPVYGSISSVVCGVTGYRGS